MTYLVDEGKAVEVSTWTSVKPLTISHSLLLEKLAVHGLDGQSFYGIKKPARRWAQRAVGNGAQVVVNHKWCSQVPVLGSVLFSIFSPHLDVRIKGTLSKKLQGTPSHFVPQGRW